MRDESFSFDTDACAGSDGGNVARGSRDTLRKIEQQHAGAPFWVVLWDLECMYCMKLLRGQWIAARDFRGLGANELAVP